MAASSRPTTTTSLQILVSPTTARPSQDSLVHALQGCTRFRLHHGPDSTPEAPHFAQVEFENEALAKKAFATVQGVSLQSGSTLYLRPVQPGLGNGNDAQEPSMPDPPKGSKLLNVTELPPEYTAGQCYDVFAKFGHIFSCVQTAKGTCQVTFYSSADAERAQTEMNFSNLGTYQIIVRFPSKYDQKDSFKAGRGLSTAASAISRPTRRTISEQVTSNASPQYSSAMQRSTSGPIRITDPIRLIVQNVPIALKAPDLFSHFESYGKLQTAALAYDQSTGSRKPLGIAVLVYATPEEASRALQALNGQFLQPLEGQTADLYKALQPLYIRLWEPRGDIEKATAFEEPVKAGSSLQATAKPFVTGDSTTSVDTPDRREVSCSSSSSTVVSPAGSRIVDSSSGTIDLTPDLKKHRRLLATALEELPPSLRNEIGGYLKHPDAVADVLVRQLQDEGERKRCVFDEAFLMKKIREALPLLEKEGDTSKGDSSPTRLYERGKLLQGESQLYSPMATTAPALEEVAAVITSPSGSGSPTLPRSRSHSPTTRIGTSAPTAEMSMDTLSRFTAAGIIALARSPAPPTLLSRPLNTSEEAWSSKISAVEAFLQSIESLKPNLQKQKLGEKIFKLLKVAVVKNAETGQMETMRNISKRTVALLDGEVLSALAHLCEEFPDVLVAKAAAADV